MGKLTAEQVANAKLGSSGSTTLSDGDGLTLVLQRQTNGEVSKKWVLRYSPPIGKLKVSAEGKTYRNIREMGLGPLRTVGLKQARMAAQRARMLIAQGIDPIERKHEAHGTVAQPKSSIPTCDKAFYGYKAAVEKGWTKGHAFRSERLWHHHVGPAFKSKLVTEVTVDDVLGQLRPLWGDHYPTAEKLRATLEVVLNFGGVNPFSNPARWRDNLKFKLARPSLIHQTENHPAMAARHVPQFVAMLLKVQPAEFRPNSQYRPIAAKALLFCVLTATRTQETADATWDEIDTTDPDGWVWTIPKERMLKTGQEHIIPLPRQAQAILEEFRGQSDWLFPIDRTSHRRAALWEIMKMFRTEKLFGKRGVPHGFRSAFSDWITENTEISTDVREMCLSHQVGNKTSRAYARSDLIEKRRHAHQLWADFACSYEGDAPSPQLHSIYIQKENAKLAAKGLPLKLPPGGLSVPPGLALEGAGILGE